MTHFPSLPVRLVWLLALSQLIACGDDDGGGTGDGGDDGAMEASTTDGGVDGALDGAPDATVYEPISVEMFCAQWREIAEAQLCADVSEEECESRLTTGAQRCESVVESIASGRTNYDGAEAARCLAEVEPSLLASGWEYGAVAGCDAFSGGVANGGPCYPHASLDTDECADGYCVWSGESCPGTCTAYQARGEICNADLRCGAEDYCLRECELPCDGTCAERPGEGEACTIACKSGLLCSPSRQECIRVRPEGSACEANEDCEQGFCRDAVCRKVATGKDQPCYNNDYCPSDLVCFGGVCQDPSPIGQPCPGGNDVCANDGVCAYPVEVEGDATCVANLGEDGDPCTYLCEEDHFCNTEGESTVCRADLGMGEDCSGSTAINGVLNLPCQAGLHCMESSTETCLPPGKLDEPCFYNRTETCEDGLWCTIVGSKCVEPATGDAFCYAIWPDTCLPTHFCGTEDGGYGGWGTDKCYPKFDLGEPCFEDRFCESDICIRANEEDEMGVCEDERPSDVNFCVP